MIPKIIHQIWLGKKKLIPKKWMESLRVLNPSWEYRLWTEDNLPEIQNNSLLRILPPFARTDIIRYEILYKFGGFYVDADSEALIPLDDFLVKNRCFSCYEHEIVCPGIIVNGFLAAEPNYVLMKALVDEISKIKIGSQVTPHVDFGPCLLTRLANDFEVTKYPSHYFLPKHYTGKSSPTLGQPKTYCNHYWGTTKNLYKSQEKIWIGKFLCCK